MKIHALVVARNEEDRYLAESLEWNAARVDTLSVVDDKSTDFTYDIAKQYATHAAGNIGFRFTANEGRFREAAWEWWLDMIDPDCDDWLVSVDADEFIMGDLRGSLDEHPHASGGFRVFEGWNLSPIRVRTDGYWGTLKEARCIRVSELLDGISFPHKKLGSGSLPKGHTDAPFVDGATILHLGYARECDRQVKYERYRRDQHHGSKHVRSIVQSPTLEDWKGETVNVEWK